MYEPNIKTTETLINSLNGIEDIRELLATIPILPIIEEPIQRQALVETVYYTARIEGNPLDIRAAQRFYEHQTSRPKADSEQEYANLYKVMDFIRYIADERDTPIDEKVIKQIQAYVVRDIPSQGSPGVYKREPNAIVDDKTGAHLFLPPSPNDTPRLMSELSAWLSQKRLAFHPIITAGLAHLELVAIHPFDNGNGRTARALVDLILWRYGYTFRRLFSWVRQVGIDTDTYHQKLREVLGPEYGASAEPATWLEYFAESIEKSLVELKPTLQNMREAYVDAFNLGREVGLTIDQVEALIFADINGYVTTADYMRVKGLSRSTVVKRLNELVKMGHLRVEGRGRGVRYIGLPKQSV